MTQYYNQFQKSSQS